MAVAIASNQRTAKSENVRPISKSVNSDTKSNLDKSLGANDSGKVKQDKVNDDKDDLQLKWETIVGSKFKVVVS